MVSLFGTTRYLADLTVTLLSNSTANARFSSVMIGKTTSSTALTGARSQVLQLMQALEQGVLAEHPHVAVG